MLTTPAAYVESLEEPGRTWLAEFLEYMRERHGDVEPIMFRQRPMFRVGESYVLFSVAKEHFTVHSLNFDLIEELRGVLPKADFGKGCVKVRFSDEAAKPRLKELIDEVIRLNRLENPPPVDTVPERSREENLSAAFAGTKAVWLSLYERLLTLAQSRLPAFVEYFPAVGVLWKHSSTFANVQCTKTALRVECFADQPRPERRPIKSTQTSANRVAYTVECREEADLGALLDWIAESYALTAKGRAKA